MERRDAVVPELLQAIHPYTGKGYCVGVTGPPGCGKSTLVNGLAKLARQDDRLVGILAVDPTSPYTGGALLGDRIRMQRHYLDRGVFIRSMATRGSRGGVATALRWAIQVLDAAGKETLLVETVGAGQSEVDVTTVADTVVVVLVPETGDAIQTMKAGLLEVADILVVNKADREGARGVVTALRGMVAMGGREAGAWRVPIISTQAHRGEGVAELYAQIKRHREFLESSSKLEVRRKNRRRQAFMVSLEEALHARLAHLLQDGRELAKVAEAVERGELDPITAAQSVVDGEMLPRQTRE